MTKAQAAKLTSGKTVSGKNFVYVRPGIVATYYIKGPVTKASAAVADAIPRYLDFVGKDAIRGYLAQNGTFKEFNKERLDRDLKVMRSAAAKAPGPDLEYSSETNGSVGQYGIVLRGADNDDKVFPLAVTLLRFEFPDDALETFTANGLLKFAMGEAVKLGAQSGGIGWGLKRAGAFASEATAAINALLPRYLGFDACYHGFGRQMRDKTPNAQWVTFIGKDLMAKCGGEKRLGQVAPSVESTVKDGITFLRAAKVPPIGDSNRGASDIGALPELARFLEPARVKIGGLGDKKLDASAWLARFDELPAKPWDNE